MKPGARNYKSVKQYFHNYEHSPEGRTHCHSTGKYPYTISHQGGRHVISGPIARGHGKGNKEQWFRFPKRLGSGYELESGLKMDSPLTSPKKVTPKPKK